MDIIEIAKELENAKKTLDVTYAENQRFLLSNMQVLEETKTRETYLADLNGRIDKATKVLQEIETEIDSSRASLTAIHAELQTVQQETTLAQTEAKAFEKSVKERQSALEEEANKVELLRAENMRKWSEVANRSLELEKREQKIKDFIKEL